MSPRRARGEGEVRIIAGRFRSRRLRFPAIAGLRPTPDRVRETLFNWLDPSLPGSHCLDLFAGSGALGFEAASRGAERVVMLERDPDALRALHENAARLGVDVDIVPADALAYLAGPATPFDIVFLDPPFASGLLASAAAALAAGAWIKPTSLIYSEAAAGEAPPVPAAWAPHRAKVAGRVSYRLWRAGGPS